MVGKSIYLKLKYLFCLAMAFDNIGSYDVDLWVTMNKLRANGTHCS